MRIMMVFLFFSLLNAYALSNPYLLVEIDQLQIITQELQIKQQDIPSKTVKEQKEASIPKPYTYYLEEAPLAELQNYHLHCLTANTLSSRQYVMLEKREVSLEEEELFNQSSIEELITAYSVNKNPKYKKRIMSLIKAAQNKL